MALGTVGTVVFSFLAALALADYWPRMTVFPIGLGLILSVIAMMVGIQSFLTGLLAEFALARTATDDPYRVAELIPEPTPDAK
jgi:hypothetical protein